MAKKGENIYRRKDGRWEGRYIKNRTSENKIIYGYVYGKKYSEVKDKLTVYKAQNISQGFYIKDSYGEWLNNYFLPLIEQRIKFSTYSNYLKLQKNYILPHLGNKSFSELNEGLFQDFISDLTKKGLSPSSIRLVFSLIKQSMKEALRLNLIQKNPTVSLKFPREFKQKVQALSVSQQYLLEKLAVQDDNGLPILISLYSGLRIGEISGLMWEDIDFKQNLICVNKTVSRLTNIYEGEKKTQIVVDSPKSAVSNRFVPISDKLKEYLQIARNKSESAYVVASRGGLSEPRVINYRFKKLIRETDFATIHFHILRHTFATRCLEQGVDIVSLSKMMGHQSTKLTLDTYSDSLMEQRMKEIKKIDHIYQLEISK
ncbi:tyrosine-type recombinase/integrase [Enterococcus sp. LJL90]